VPYRTMRLLTVPLFKNRTDTQGKLRLNLHSLSVNELLEYGRKSRTFCASKVATITKQLRVERDTTP
jgi:hypothetical protein